MKLIKNMMIACAISSTLVISTDSTAAQNCATCGGYFYTAIAATNNGGIVSNQYATRGPYASAEECQQAVNLDLGNNDSWLPFYGSPICTYRFETDYDAYREIIDHWNNSAPPSGNGVNVMDNKELVGKLLKLREEFDVGAYERKVDAAITDPEID